MARSLRLTTDPRGIDMHLRTLLLSTATTALLLGSLAPAAEAVVPVQDVQSSVAAATGLDTAVVRARTTLAAGTVSPATDPDGTPLTTLVHDAGEAGYALVAVLDRGRSEADFRLDLPPEATLRPDRDGALRVVDRTNGLTIGSVAAPWALDAVGALLPTRYTVLADGRLRQHVDTTDAVYPVAADPAISFGFHRGIAVAYMQWNRSETIRIAKIAGPVGAVAAAICSTLQVDWRVRAACTAVVGPYAADMVATAQVAARTSGRCFKMRVPLYPVAAAIWLTYDSYHVPC